jgi:23S rRNA (uridine2552-2'-O)-methyltransferase
MDLARAALRIAEKVLRPGGSFVVKAFQGAEFGKFLSSLRKRFGFIKVSKPFASRKGSAEVYVVGKGFRG